MSIAGVSITCVIIIPNGALVDVVMMLWGNVTSVGALVDGVVKLWGNVT